MPRRPDICRTPEPNELQSYLRDNPAMVKNFVERRVVAMPEASGLRQVLTALEIGRRRRGRGPTDGSSALRTIDASISG